MPRWLVHNWELKLLAVLMAAVVWFFVVSADRSQIGFAAPVEYVGLEGSRISRVITVYDVRPGQPGLQAKRQNLAEQGFAPLAVQMRHRLIQQQDFHVLYRIADRHGADRHD